MATDTTKQATAGVKEKKKAKRTKPPWLKVKLPTGDNYKKVR